MTNREFCKKNKQKKTLHALMDIWEYFFVFLLDWKLLPQTNNNKKTTEHMKQWKRTFQLTGPCQKKKKKLNLCIFSSFSTSEDYFSLVWTCEKPLNLACMQQQELRQHLWQRCMFQSLTGKSATRVGQSRSIPEPPRLILHTVLSSSTLLLL